MDLPIALVRADVQLRGIRGDLRLGLCLAATGVVAALLAGVLAPADPAALGPAGQALQPPSASHPLGTDPLGRDVWSRVLHGGRISLLVGWSTMALAAVMGTAVGLAAGLGPRRLQRGLTWLVDLFLAFPGVYLVLLLVAVSRPSLGLLIAVLAVSSWMDVARLVRIEAIALRDREFIVAARGLGVGGWAVAWRHVLPNVLPTVVVAGALRIGQAILLESFLSYLGLGPQEPLVTWGAMIAQGRANLLDGWWLTAFPGAAIALTVLAYNLIADGLRSRLLPGGEQGR
ncbi:MAG TPA: ABC transporter permease [Candidatus Krumholzibacteria bacterium]|nr:ABC transporter permease [Candidatus Krumholzibacteria bacterium]HPD71341.1 ABC transporter permease [Candidatus Krumholzibacteria bacterium]HRY38959.1 ABC transporter permease [Candidatus Krumholzibacteria bacterium]